MQPLPAVIERRVMLRLPFRVSQAVKVAGDETTIGAKQPNPNAGPPFHGLRP
jgi:hypothetical protein